MPPVPWTITTAGTPCSGAKGTWKTADALQNLAVDRDGKDNEIGLDVGHICFGRGRDRREQHNRGQCRYNEANANIHLALSSVLRASDDHGGVGMVHAGLSYSREVYVRVELEFASLTWVYL